MSRSSNVPVRRSEPDIPVHSMLFEVFSQRYERGATLVTSNLPFDEWRGLDGSHRLAEIVEGVKFKDGEKLIERAA